MFFILYLLVAVPILALLNAYVVSTLWGWFIVPFGASSIGLAHAYGLSIFITYLTSKIDLDKVQQEQDDEERIKRAILVFVIAIFKAAFFILVGFIAKSLM